MSPGWVTALLVLMGESFIFDNAKLYAKWLEDIEQSQTAEGRIPESVAPNFWFDATNNNMTLPYY